MVSILTEDVGPESHLLAIRDALSAIFRHRRDPGAHVTTLTGGIFPPAYGLSGKPSCYVFMSRYLCQDTVFISLN